MNQKYCETCEHFIQVAADDWKCQNQYSSKYGCSLDYYSHACNCYERGWCLNPQISRPAEKWTPKKVLFEDVGYEYYQNVNVYACICPDCGLHIFEFTDDDVDDKCDSDNPEVMFKSSMAHHGYMGLDNFCNRCGRRLDWGDYPRDRKEIQWLK